MYTLYKFHLLNGTSEINQLFDDILIIWPAPVYHLRYLVIDVLMIVCFAMIVCLMIIVLQFDNIVYL